MKALPILLTAAATGLCLGWLSAPKGAELTADNQSGPVAKQERAQPRPRANVSALQDVEACRRQVAESLKEDGRHPLLRRMEYLEALRRWIELDPESALAEARKSPAEPLARDLMVSWVEMDPQGALTALRRAGRPLIAAVATDFFVKLMTRDPSLAAAELGRPPWAGAKEDFLGWSFNSEVYTQWMMSDPESAIARLKSLPASNGNSWSPSHTLLKAWAALDFDAAWAYCKSDQSGFSMQSDGLLAIGLLKGLPGARAALDGMLSQEIDHVGGSERRDYLCSSVARSMADSNPAEALEVADDLQGDDVLKNAIYFRVAEEIAGSDPSRALELLKQSGEGKGRYMNSVLRDTLSGMAAEDPGKARDAISSLPDAWKADAISGYLTRQFITDPEDAAARCQEWLADPALAASLKKGWAISFSWGYGSGVRDPGPILEAIPALNDSVTDYVLSTWVKGDPEAAAGWISNRLDEGKKVPFGSQGVLEDLAISSPVFMSGWLMNLPDAKIQEKAATTLVGNWAAYDPSAARQWIESLPEGELRTAAEAGLKPQVTDPNDPFAAF